MRALQAPVVGRKVGPAAGGLEQPPGFQKRALEDLLVELGVGQLERVSGELILLLSPHVSVERVGRPAQLVDVVDVLDIHRDALEPVGDLSGDGSEVEPARLLEVRELRDFLPVEEDLPADAPRPESGRLPVVLLEAHVVSGRVDPEGRQARQVDVLDVGRRRLEDHLELLVLVETVRVLTVAAVGGAPGGLHVSHAPWPGTEHSKERFRMHRPGADLAVPRLMDQAAALGPEDLKREDDLLKRQRAASRVASRITRGERSSRSRWRATRSR